MTIKKNFITLSKSMEGNVSIDSLTRHIYATDGSIYQEVPQAVAFPKTLSDIKKIVLFASKHKIGIIPRTAGTSLAGQCVGDGIVMDVSKYFNSIIKVCPKENWVEVESGVIRDELNHFLKPYGLFFSPNTSTANRAMIGGMVGNNSCGSTSIEYGTTRDHVLSIETILSDGSEATFSSVNDEEFLQKIGLKTLEGKIYRKMISLLKPQKIQDEIVRGFPKPEIHRRNTGYALDELLKQKPFGGKLPFNLAKFLCGSEGTLAISTRIKLHVNKLPLPFEVVVVPHFYGITESLKATQLVMKHKPCTCELMDKTILDCTKKNLEQSRNRFFIKGNPKAVLIIEFRGNTLEEAEKKAHKMIHDLKRAKMGYAFPVLYNPQSKCVWNLRKAGLGLLAHLEGKQKAIACVEDTAVSLENLPEYIREFSEIMEKFKQKAIYYAHAGAGEIHLRPILNLRNKKDWNDFHLITKACAQLVKKYKGSLSGEHGDGRVRAPFIPLVLGKKNYHILKQVKKLWDPKKIFNPYKIIDPKPIASNLRDDAKTEIHNIETCFDLSDTGGIFGMVDKCNGSGDCRKLPLSGGTMCPSYHATRNEKDTTRSRANALRTFLAKPKKKNVFYQKELKEVLDLCLSCKACSTECPSSVDMALLKSEFQYQYRKSRGTTLRDYLFGNYSKINAFLSKNTKWSNYLLTQSSLGYLTKKMIRVAPSRSFPKLAKISLRKWFDSWEKKHRNADKTKGIVYLFCDEFTLFNDVQIGIKAIKLLTHLGYEVKMTNYLESGRSQISKGFLKQAKKLAEKNVIILENLISEDYPLVGIEPSAILSFRDEYPKLVDKKNKISAKKLAKNCLLFEEFIDKEFQKGHISSEDFSTKSETLALHLHCHQKALSNLQTSVKALSIPKNFKVQVIPSGCCGMAGSFGYEKEHYAVSQKIANLVLFPTIKSLEKNTKIVTSGTSCRHQIFDGLNKPSFHPIEILYSAIKDNLKG